jgi:PEP-CTERM motif
MAKSSVLLAALLLFVTRPATATTITVDENANGFVDSTRITGFIGNDPGPGGLTGVLIYNLPFAGVQGDVGLTDAAEGGLTLDYLRFNGNGTLIFYSDNLGGADSLADTASPPLAFYTNLLRIPEVGPEGNNGAFYTPTAGQPGFNPASAVTYHFVSDGTANPVPEPATLALLGTGALVGLLRRKRRSE